MSDMVKIERSPQHQATPVADVLPAELAAPIPEELLPFANGVPAANAPQKLDDRCEQPTGSARPLSPSPRAALAAPAEENATPVHGEREVLMAGLERLLPTAPPSAAPSEAFVITVPSLTVPQPLPPIDTCLALSLIGQFPALENQLEAETEIVRDAYEHTAERIAATCLQSLPPTAHSVIVELSQTLATKWPAHDLFAPNQKHARLELQKKLPPKIAAILELGSNGATHARSDVVLPSPTLVALETAARQIASVPEASIEALVAIVMFETSRSAREGVGALLTEVKQNNEKKKVMREFISAGKKRRADLEKALHDRYTERCAAPLPMYIDSSQVSFEEFKLSQMLAGTANLPSPDDGNNNPRWPDLMLSSQETLYPPPAPAEEETTTEAARQSSQPSTMRGNFGITSGYAQAILDLWAAFPPEKQALYGSSIEQFMTSEMGLVAGEPSQGPKVEAYFASIRNPGATAELPFNDDGKVICTGIKWSLSNNEEENRAAADALYQQLFSAVGADAIKAVQSAVANLVKTMMETNHAVRENHPRRNELQTETLPAAKKALEAALNAITPAAARAQALSFCGYRMAELACELQKEKYEYDMKALIKTAGGYYRNKPGDDILGGARLDGKKPRDRRGHSDVYVRANQLQDIMPNFYLDPRALQDTRNQLWDLIGGLSGDGTTSDNPLDVDGALSDPWDTVVQQFVTGEDRYQQNDAARATADESADAQRVHSDASEPVAATVGEPQGPTFSLAQFDANLDAWQGQMDSLADVSSELSLKLQMGMDALSKVESTLSNLVKKFSDTANTITGNLK